MVSYNVSSDNTMKLVRKWCKENNINVSFDDKVKDVIYPMVLDMPKTRKKELDSYIKLNSKKGKK